MAPELTDQALARTAAAIHGCCKASRQRPVPATVTEAILALAGRPRAKRSMQAVIAIAMARGNSIRPVSTGAKPIAGTAVQRTTIMLRTA